MFTARRALAIAATLILPTLASAQTYPSKDDPRSKLKAGRYDAGEAALNMRLVSSSKKAAVFDTAGGLAFINSDLAFGDKYVYQGNFSGFTVWDVSTPQSPKMVAAVSCVTSQGDPTIVGHLLFLSAEGGGNRNDCAKGGVKDPKDHMAGVRIYDVSNPAEPKLIKNVQTCKGSHTHTLVPSKKDKEVVYLYVSGFNGARKDTEMPGCKESTNAADESNSLYRLDIIKVPLAHPEQSTVIGGARVFTGLDPAPSVTGRPSFFGNSGPRNCHDVTVYPDKNLLAGACGSHGILVDISNPEKPIRAPTPTSPSGTPPFSLTMERRSSSPTSGGAARRRCARRTRRWRWVVTRFSRSTRRRSSSRTPTTRSTRRRRPKKTACRTTGD
jgi:hypothetical protein